MHPPWPHQPPAEAIGDPDATRPFDVPALWGDGITEDAPCGLPGCLPGPRMRAPLRARLAVGAWLMWPAQVRAFKRAGYRRVGWMTWEAGPSGGGP